MKKLITQLTGSVTLIVLSLITGCGGGGGGGNGPTSTPVTYKFRTYSSGITNFGTYSGIKAINFRVDLPVGVSVATDPGNAKMTADGVVRYSGIMTTTFKNLTSLGSPKPLWAGYSTAKPAGSGRNVLWVNFYISENSNLVFDEGEFIAINCLAAPGANTSKSGVTVTKIAIEGNYIGINSNDLFSKYLLGVI